MLIRRRSLLAALASVPLIGRLVPAATLKQPKVVRFRMLMQRFDKQWVAETVGTVNSTPWLGRPARRWLLTDIDIRQHGHAWEVTTTFKRGKIEPICGVLPYTEIDYNQHYFGNRIT